MQSMTLTPIGHIHFENGRPYIAPAPAYAPALTALAGFSHIQVLWWFSACDTPEMRQILLSESPYRGGPETVGTFATRGPLRPNPIALTAAGVTALTMQAGRIELDWIDAQEGAPVLDIKPYTPSADRVESPRIPDWCAAWPRSLEASEGFDWGAVFNF